MMPPWHHWEGRPITVGTLRGQGGGRSLIVNGHIDVVSPGDLERWTTPPFDADVRDGRIYGRGAVDMKGGVAAALFALRALADDRRAPAGRRDLRGGARRGDLRDGDGRGDRARLPGGRRARAGADAAEPVDRDARAAARLVRRPRPLRPRRGQPGAAGRTAAASTRSSAPCRCSRRWASSAASGGSATDKRHPLLGTPQAQPTIVARRRVHLQRARGARRSTSTRPTCRATRTPPGTAASRARRSSPPSRPAPAATPGCASTRCSWTWATDYPPSEIPPGEAIVATRRATSRASSALEGRLEGIDTTYDGALLTRLAGVPEPGLRARRPRPRARAGRVDRDRGAAAGRARLHARADQMVRRGMNSTEGEGTMSTSETVGGPGDARPRRPPPAACSCAGPPASCASSAARTSSSSTRSATRSGSCSGSSRC